MPDDTYAQFEEHDREMRAELDALVRKDLRDEFAKAALIGLITQTIIAEAAQSAMKAAEAHDISVHEVIARCAYAYADAMLRVREKGGA